MKDRVAVEAEQVAILVGAPRGVLSQLRPIRAMPQLDQQAEEAPVFALLG